jgi:hypothetical protein
VLLEFRPLRTSRASAISAEPANWKRYRGGTAGRLWVGPATAMVSDAPGAAGRVPVPFRRVLADLPAQFGSPMIVGGRLAFISDHEGTGNVYSCALDGSDLRRHTDHDGWYARQASTDGRRIVYARGGELWLLADLQAAGPVRLDIALGSPVHGRAPRLVTAEDHVGSLSVDHGGRASSIEVRGTVHWLTHRDGPARAVSVVPGARARFPQVLGTGGQVVWATDADGSDSLEIGPGDPASPVDPAAAPRRIAAGPDGPGPLLIGVAGKPVELTVAPADGSRLRSVPVVPLRSDTRLRYLDWVRAKRAQVRELSRGRIGYLHVPDMVSQGWADFHRDLRTEMLRDALIVDVRGNTGGHTSELVVEKLARKVIAWDVQRGMMPSTYPEDAPRGPVVAIADECSGSDGDIVTGAIRLLRLGPVVGARTWGGVIGYDDEHELIDGTRITVPRLAFWFEEYGWGVENHGVNPDVEVIMSPDDWAAERDTQLETAVRLALEALQKRPAVRPPDQRTRPSRRRPPLPPRV